MSARRGNIGIQRGESVDFLGVPRENVVNLRPPKKEAPSPQPRTRSAQRTPRQLAARFLIVLLLVVTPFVGVALWQRAQSLKGQVLGSSTEALNALEEAATALTALDGELANRQFAQAAASFRSARSDIERFGVLVDALGTVLPSASQAKSGRELLRAGEAFSTAGVLLSDLVVPFLTPEEERVIDFTTLLRQSQEKLPTAVGAIDDGLAALANVKAKDVPEGYRTTFERITAVLPQLREGVARFSQTTALALDLLGGSGPRRYLVLFQNNLELRPTGGFIGSVALIDVANGKITKLTVPTGGAYDFKGDLSERVIAPEPLHIVNAHWQLQDANWWPDFPTSAEKILWFFEKSGGVTVDGLIAMTPDLLVDLLAATGPIDLTETYGRTITAENAVQETLLAVQENPDEPKQIIADLLPEVLDRVFLKPSVDPLSTFAAFERALTERHLLLYFPDAAQQERVASLGWDGRMLQSDGDYLMVVDTNIGGGKTDGVIDETIQHTAVIAQDGSIDVTVTLTRVHHGTVDDPFTGVRNVDYVRFYVPEGSELIGVDGFERIDPKRFMVPDQGYEPDDDLERIDGRVTVDARTNTATSVSLGKTVFANWMGVGPGETAVASITYRLPFALTVDRDLFGEQTDTYSLLVQKQPGANGRYLVSQVTFPASYAPQWIGPEERAPRISAQSLEVSAPLTTDIFYGAVFGPKD